MKWFQLSTVRVELIWPPEPKALLYAVVCMFTLLLLGVIGATITQSQPEGIVLDRRQWQRLKVQRQSRQDVAHMTRDLSQLALMISAQPLDPVETVMLAQRFYTRYQTGAVSTAAARQALITAGQIAVQVASGVLPPEKLNEPLQTVQALLTSLRNL